MSLDIDSPDYRERNLGDERETPEKKEFAYLNQQNTFLRNGAARLTFERDEARKCVDELNRQLAFTRGQNKDLRDACHNLNKALGEVANKAAFLTADATQAEAEMPLMIRTGHLAQDVTVMTRWIRGLRRAVIIAHEALEGVYDGAPDSPTRGLGQALDELRSAKTMHEALAIEAATTRDIFMCLRCKKRPAFTDSGKYSIMCEVCMEARGHFEPPDEAERFDMSSDDGEEGR